MALALSPKELEKIVRGFSSHRRIQVLELLDQSDEAMSLNEIADACRVGITPLAEHVRRLAVAGFITKTRRNREILHDVTPQGKKIIAFLRTFKAS